MKNVKDYNKSLNEGKLKFSDIKKGDFLKKGKGNFELEVLDVSVGKRGFDDSVTLYNDVTGYKTEIVDLGEYTLVEASEDFAGWVAIYNNNRIEIDKSEADGIYQAKQIAIKKLKVPKSKVGLLAIAPGYNESMYEAKEDKLYKSIDALEKEARKILAPIEIGSFIAQLDDLRQFLQGNVVLEKIEMNNLDWGKTTAERNKNLDHFDSLKTDKEKEDFKKKLKSMNEGKNDYSARFGKTDITIKNGHKLTDEDSLYDMYEKIGKVIKDSGLDLGSVIIK
tara:strand:- start:3144 stop:3980 length:837 start_codon:yes stop_codon:yes gene_type:complete